jgi:predicted nucleic acid-binding protein
MRYGLDTNFLAYFAGVDRSPADGRKIDLARHLVGNLGADFELVVPVQVLGELFVVLQRAGASREEARDIVTAFSQDFSVVPSERQTFLAALDLSVRHQFQMWDALIVNAAADAGCIMLLTEDMQDGFTWRGMKITDPFEEVQLRSGDASPRDES